MSYTVKVEPEGQSFPIEAGETVLAAALGHGLALPYGCRDGRCGACKGKIVQGQVDHGQAEMTTLTQTERDQGYALLCQATPKSDLVVNVEMLHSEQDLSPKIYPCKVSLMQRLNHDVMVIKLKLPANERMPFLAGQYIDFLLKDGRHRSFSIANAPHEDEFIELHVRHIDGGRFTSDVFDKMKEKDIQRIQGPKGGFYLRENSRRPIIYMAGGTGLAPVKAIIEHAIAARIERPMHLYWGVRAVEDLYMDEVIRQWTQRYPLIRYTPVLSEPKPSDNWQGRTGYVHDAIMADYADLSGFEIYGSGPPAMVYAGRDVFPSHGLDLTQYFSDAFEFSKD